MKKVLTGLFAAMAISASCFAAGASGTFAKEEKAADGFVEALTGNTVTYAQVSKNFNAELVKNFTAAQFETLKKQVNEKIGKINKADFVGYNKGFNLNKGYNGMEELIYLASIKGNKHARISVVFIQENGAPKIASFVIAPLEEAPAKK